MVPIVLCFGIDFLRCLNRMYVIYFYLCPGNREAAYWEIAAHSAYDMFCKYKYLIVNLVFSPPRFLEWDFLSDCAFS